MNKKPLFVLVAATMLAPSFAVAPAFAQDRYERQYVDRGYRDAPTYRSSDGRYYYCKRSSGTTGAIAGGVGGAVVGNVLGGGVLGTVAGGVGGALLGKHLDKKHDAAQNRKNGC